MLEELEKAERLNTVTQQVGFAVWQLQELEGCSAIYFVLLAQATQGMGSDAGEALVKKAQSKTFGATIKELVKADLLTPELAAEFARLLEERNWLVHRSRADSRGAIHGDGSVQQLLRRIDAIADDALVLLKKIGSLTARFTSEHGISQKYIDQESRRLQKEWAARD
jgi:uncharacterized protein YutE (UPF0331/DUF86 family)